MLEWATGSAVVHLSDSEHSSPVANGFFDPFEGELLQAQDFWPRPKGALDAGLFSTSRV